MKFGIYSFSFKKDNELTGIKALKGNKGHFMIGEVDLSADAYKGKDLEESCFQRIEQEIQPKNALQHFVKSDLDNFQFFICEGNENHQDSKFREFITGKNPRIKTFKDKSKNVNTEILTNISKDEIKEYFQAWQKGDRNFLRTLSFGLRNYQNDIVNDAVKIAKKNGRVLIHLSTRGGKSFVALEAAKKTGANNILILTPFPSAVGSFREIVERHSDFKDWWFFDRDNMPKHDDDYISADNNVYFLSFQNKWGESEKLEKLLQKIEFDTVIIDETHVFSSSFRSGEILKKIPHKYEIHLSGTPFGDIYSKRFNEDEIVTKDFIDLMEDDKNSKHTLVGFPELTIKNVCNMSQLNETLVKLKPDFFEKDEQFNLKKVFDTPERAQHFFDFAFNPRSIVESDKTLSLLADKSNNHILMFVPTVKAVWNAYEALNASTKTIPFLNEYAIAKPYKSETDDPNDFDFGDLENSLNEFQETHKKTIIITCAKLTTGVTLKKCDCVLLMKSISSAEVFIQTLFRCMTGDWENKKKATLYNYDSEACIRVMKEVMKVLQTKTPQTQREALARLMNVINIQSTNSYFDFVNEDASSYLQKIKEIPVRFECDDVIQNFNFDLSDSQIEALSSVAGSKSAKSVDIAKGLGGNEKVDNNKKSSNLDVSIKSNVEEKAGAEKMKDKIKALFKNIDWEIIINKITSFGELAKIMPSTCDNDELKNIYLNTLNFNRTKITQFIEDFNESINNKPDDVFKNMSMLNDTDFVTPDALCELMCSKMTFKKTDTVLDPCCGRGGLLIYIHKKFGLPKEQLYGYDIDERNVIFLKRLGYMNVELTAGSELEKNWKKNMKFDHIIMNPPYSGSLHLKILREAMKHSDDIVNLSPIRWLQDPLAEYKRNSDYKKFENIMVHIESLYPLDPKLVKKMFNANFTSEIGIYHITKNGGWVREENTIINKILEKENDILANHLEYNINDGWRVRVSEMRPTPAGRPETQVLIKTTKYETTHSVLSWVYKDGFTPDGKLYWTENNLNGGHGVKEFKKDAKLPMSIPFKTYEEAFNFENSTKTKFHHYMVSKMKTDQHFPFKFVPYLGDYTHPWTDQMLYDYFGLTDDEIKTIEKEI